MDSGGKFGIWIKVAIATKVAVSTTLTGLTKAPESTKVAIRTKVKIWIQVTNLANLAIFKFMFIAQSPCAMCPVYCGNTAAAPWGLCPRW